MKVLNAYHEHMLMAISYTFFVGNASRSGLLKFSSLVEPSSVTSPLERVCDKLCCFDKAAESALSTFFGCFWKCIQSPTLHQTENAKKVFTGNVPLQPVRTATWRMTSSNTKIDCVYFAWSLKSKHSCGQIFRENVIFRIFVTAAFLSRQWMMT